MSENTDRINTFLDGFRTLDREQILGCLTDDVRWTMFGAYQIEGKQAYDEHITEPGFRSAPLLRVVRMVEQGEEVMAELYGEVRSDDGQLHRLATAEVFRMRDGLICERRAFVVPMTSDEY